MHRFNYPRLAAGLVTALVTVSVAIRVPRARVPSELVRFTAEFKAHDPGDRSQAPSTSEPGFRLEAASPG